ncbi:hypothetical protein AB0H58_32500 [Nocardia neocaledoniensis]|uniref:hypothetical protein n=1 Tax=Nocardia neocaledoniensis TaxID=236511 RepID=UPI0033FEB90A
MRTQLAGLAPFSSVARFARKVATAVDARTAMVAVMLLVGVALQLTLLLSVGRAPADMLLPHSGAAAVSAISDIGADGCVMFCDEPALGDSELALDFAPDLPAADELRSFAAVGPAGERCWMFCGQAIPGGDADSPPSWHMAL